MNPDTHLLNRPEAEVVDDESGAGRRDPDKEFSTKPPPACQTTDGQHQQHAGTADDAKSGIGQRVAGSFTKAAVKTPTNAPKYLDHVQPWSHVGAAHHFPKMDTPPNNFNTASNEPVRVHQPMMAENPAAPNAMVLVKRSEGQVQMLRRTSAFDQVWGGAPSR